MEMVISIIALVIAISGWIVTYIFTIRAQNKNFINQVINHARIEITRAIRDYQDWLGAVHVEIFNIDYKFILEEQNFSVDWLKRRAELGELFFSGRSALEWIFRLEEHEILFPKTAKCRKDLVVRQEQILEYLRSFLHELPSGFGKPPDFNQRKEAIKKAQNNAGIIVDQLALMEDLRIYLQNLCLSSFTGNKIPERKPKKSSLPRLVQDEGGNLHISVTQNTTKDGGG
jgi:hypothetical protein